jgi:hypothetical protein
MWHFLWCWPQPENPNQQQPNTLDSWDFDNPMGFLPSPSNTPAPAEDAVTMPAADSLLFSPWALSSSLNTLPGIDLLTASDTGLLARMSKVRCPGCVIG